MSSARAPVILLPPSEGKAEGGDIIWDPDVGPFGSLGRHRRRAARRLAEAMSADEDRLRRLLGVKGDALVRARTANRKLIRKPLALPASQRFSGVVHDHLGLDRLGRAAAERAERGIVFFSALGGVLAPGDPLPDHRAKMSISLDGLGKVSRWWLPFIDEALASHLAGRVVIDLLPNEHAEAFTPRPDRWRGWIQARFERELADGTRKAIGHEAKAGKGLFARHLVEAGDSDDDTLTAFTTSDGWSVDGIEEPDDPKTAPRVVVVARRDA